MSKKLKKYNETNDNKNVETKPLIKDLYKICLLKKENSTMEIDPNFISHILCDYFKYPINYEFICLKLMREDEMSLDEALELINDKTSYDLVMQEKPNVIHLTNIIFNDDMCDLVLVKDFNHAES